MAPRRSILVVPALLVALAACGESNPMGDDPDDDREILASPSFATDINEIFQRRGCSSGACHGNNAGGLTLTADAAANFAAIVGVQAQAEDFLRIDPGDPDDSYIVIKVEGRQSVGQRMPRGQSPLDAIDLTNIRNWISNGAPNN